MNKNSDEDFMIERKLNDYLSVYNIKHALMLTPYDIHFIFDMHKLIIDSEFILFLFLLEKSNKFLLLAPNTTEGFTTLPVEEQNIYVNGLVNSPSINVIDRSDCHFIFETKTQALADTLFAMNLVRSSYHCD